MQNSILTKFRFKNTARILSVLSLVMFLISILYFPVITLHEYNDITHEFYVVGRKYEGIQYVLSNAISLCLLLSYFFLFYKKPKGEALLLLSFIISLFSHYASLSHYFRHLFSYVLFPISLCVGLGLIYCFLEGFTQKRLLNWIFTVFMVLYFASWLLDIIGHGEYMYRFLCSCSYILLYISFFLFGRGNMIPPKIKVTPESKLQNLKARFDAGAISKEEYKAQKAKILSEI